MCTGGLFWVINEIGHQRSMESNFQKEFNVAKTHCKEYRYLYGMIKETVGPREALFALLPHESSLSYFLDTSGSVSETDQQLDHAFRVILENRGLDSA